MRLFDAVHARAATAGPRRGAWSKAGPGPAPPEARVESAVGTIDVPEHIRALTSLPDAHYSDVFTLSTDVDATPEQWARAMFGDVPDVAEQLIWRGLLGMRLSRGRSPDTVAGWQIAGRGENWVRLEARSWFLTGNLVVRATNGEISLATFVSYDRSLGRLVWPPLSAVHRRLAPGLLRDAATEVRAPRRETGSPSWAERLGNAVADRLAGAGERAAIRLRRMTLDDPPSTTDHADRR